MSTLLLDRSNWDLVVGADGNIALATDPYAQIQDVASACRLFIGELYYDTTRGIRYFEQVLGRPQPLAVLKSQLAAAATSVSGVQSAVALLTAVGDRTVTGQVQAKLTSGESVIVAL